ncbi:protein FAM228B isoform X3 [Empidonax traillii]|uniref:protein FAM228B isoform X3 n=1 Tax=Empidonax traillii TaxID=164674 RepID=UPI000FFD99E4|nr:protein FAM228B isoform X3 [Empidonax traillii]
MAPLQIIPTMHSGKSSEISWLKNMTHLRPVREPDQPRPWREVDRYLRHNDFLNLRKKEIVYKEWLKDVLEPVLQKIEDKMSSQSIEEMQKRKQEQLSQYLNYCKKKGYVFLDHFDPSEYDPFSQKMCTDCWKDGSHQSPQ